MEPSNLAETKLTNRDELLVFLAEVERRAFKQAVFAVRDEHVALDIVQDAMIKLVTKYASRPAEEFPLIFQRILQNTIRDSNRRQRVRSKWITLFSSFTAQHDDEDHDPLDTLPSFGRDSENSVPEAALEQTQLIGLIEEALMDLPARQREAFLLRYWEDMDTAETAAAMGCSEGSVKTHCSRATHALADALRKKGVNLS